MAASSHSASSNQRLIPNNRANSGNDELFSHVRQIAPTDVPDPSNGKNPFIPRDPTTLSTNDLAFDKVLEQNTDVEKQTIVQVNIENEKGLRKVRRSELASKKGLLTRVWQLALAVGLVAVALAAGIGGLAYWITLPKAITQPYLLYDESCLMNSRSCDETRLLWCPAGRCVCLGNFNWNSTAQNCSCVQYQIWNGIKCLSYGSYGDPCSTSMPCLPTLSLSCQPVINQTYSTGQAICDCNNATYLNTSSGNCVAKKSFNAACQAESECATWLGVACTNTVGGPRCLCDSTSYWNGTLCVGNALGWQPCSATIPCDTTRGLYCNSSLGTCECDYLSFWNNATTRMCEQKKSYGAVCAYNFQCNTTVNLSCPTVSTGCNCPLASSAGRCDCQLSSFWDGQRCVALHSFNGTCLGQYACTSNLVCYLGHCICPGNMVWFPPLNCSCPGTTSWSTATNTCI